MFWFVSKQFCLFQLFRYRFETPKQTKTNRNKPKLFVFGFTKQTETQPKQLLFWFVSVKTEKFVCLLRGHPTFTVVCRLCRWRHLVECSEDSICDFSVHRTGIQAGGCQNSVLQRCQMAVVPATFQKCGSFKAVKVALSALNSHEEVIRDFMHRRRILCTLQFPLHF